MSPLDVLSNVRAALRRLLDRGPLEHLSISEPRVNTGNLNGYGTGAKGNNVGMETGKSCDTETRNNGNSAPGNGSGSNEGDIGDGGDDDSLMDGDGTGDSVGVA